jgi:hypothetical protein
MTKTEMFCVQGLRFGHIGTGEVQRTQTHIAACPCTQNISVLVILVLVRFKGLKPTPLNLTSTNMTKTEIFSVQGQAAMWV